MSESRGESPILVVGPPRSGTTWVAHVVSAHPGLLYVHEPDNEKSDPLGFVASSTLHRFPCLSADQEHPGFESIWHTALSGVPVHRPARSLAYRLGILDDAAVERDIRARCSAERTEASTGAGGRPAPRLGPWRDRAVGILAGAERRAARTLASRARPLVKTVHAMFTLEWIAARFPVTVVSVTRNPLNVVASYLRMRFRDADRWLDRHAGLLERRPHYRTILHPGQALAEKGPADGSGEVGVRRRSRQLAVMMDAIDRFAGTHEARTVVVRHEELCADPVEGFRHLFGRLGLEWSAGVERHIDSMDRPGRGFATQRRTRLQIDKWKRELEAEQVDWIASEFERAGRAGDLSTG